MDKKYYTLEEANRLLPFVRKELSQLQQVKEDLLAAHARLHTLKSLPHASDDDALFKMEGEIEFMKIQADTYIRSMMMKEVELKSIDAGLIDFPALLDGEEVYLCWRQDEERIEYYHGLHDGFRGRKKWPDGR